MSFGMTLKASVTTDWFQGRGLAFALGLNISFARIAAALNDNLSPVLAKRIGVPAAGWMGVLVTLLSSVSSIFLVFLDSNEARRKAGVHVIDDDPVVTVDQVSVLETGATDQREPLINTSQSAPTVLIEPSSSAQKTTSQNNKLVEGPFTEILDIATPPEDESYDSEEYDEEDETIHFSQIRGFSYKFWLVFINTIALYGECTNIPR